MTAEATRPGAAGERAGAPPFSTGRPPGLPRIGFVSGFASGVMWGLDGVVLGVVLGMAPFVGGSAVAAPLAVAGLHDTASCLWMLLFDASTGRLERLRRLFASRRGMVIWLAALFGGPLAMSGYVYGIRFAGAAYTLAISATFPAVGALLAAVFLRERVTRLGWLGVAVTITGAVLVSYTPPEGSPEHFYLGIGLALLATFGWGVEGVLAIHSMEVIDAAVAGTIRMATSMIIYFAIVIPLTGGYGLVVEALQTPDTVLVLTLGAIAGAGAYLTYYAANHLIGASRAMPLNAMYALWAILFGIVFTGLQPTWQLVLGVLVTLCGAVLVVRAAPAPEAVAQPSEG
jgi:drug/metabolite transporter (DMT)-like permease